MTEYRFFTEDVPFVSTAEFHKDRERAPHLEQNMHIPRLFAAAELIRRIARDHPTLKVSDLGCGDGGLLSLIQNDVKIAWGYDFAPANVAGWAERGVAARHLDIFNAQWDEAVFGDLVVMTEVLEHLADPHGILKRLYAEEEVRWVVASSPRNETPESHSGEHAWAWDVEGYVNLFETTGWHVTQHVLPDEYFQVVLAERQ